MKTLILALALITISGLSVAQTSAAKKSPTSPAAKPWAKVTGEPTKTPSGLEYWDLKEGTGAPAQAGQHVTVDYTVWLSTGKKVDSSVGTGHPFDFMLGAGQVIKGWDEGIAGMKVGAKRQLRIPPELAYGEMGFKTIVPPNATLIFDVQLLAVTPAPPSN
jgi:FKBP-type peptidyl-prolyl cis-trans isomerase FkpA